MDSVFNNREIAVGIWLLVFLVWALRIENVRKFINPLFKALSARPVVVIFSLMAGYILLVVLLLAKMELWNANQLKNTVLWFFVFAVVELFKADNIKSEDNYFRESFKQHVNLLVVFQFVVSLNSFHLLVELIMVPASVFLALMLGFSEGKEKYKPVTPLVSALMSALGFILLAGSAVYIYNNYEKVAQSQTLLDFLVPVILSFFLLPFVYLVSIYMKYESALIIVNLYTDDPSSRFYAKLKSLLHFKFNRKKIRDWALHASKSDFQSRESIDKSIQSHIFT